MPRSIRTLLPTTAGGLVALSNDGNAYACAGPGGDWLPLPELPQEGFAGDLELIKLQAISAEMRKMMDHFQEATTPREPSRPSLISPDMPFPPYEAE